MKKSTHDKGCIVDRGRSLTFIILSLAQKSIIFSLIDYIENNFDGFAKDKWRLAISSVT